MHDSHPPDVCVRDILDHDQSRGAPRSQHESQQELPPIVDHHVDCKEVAISVPNLASPRDTPSQSPAAIMPLNSNAPREATVAENEANSNRYIEANAVMDCHQLVYFARIQ